MAKGNTGNKRKIKRAAKSAVKQIKRTSKIAKGGMNNKNKKGYATKYPSTKNVKYRGTQIKKKRR